MYALVLMYALQLARAVRLYGGVRGRPAAARAARRIRIVPGYRTVSILGHVLGTLHVGNKTLSRISMISAVLHRTGLGSMG